MAQELKKREEMDSRYQWRLDHIFATEADFEAAFAQAQGLVEAYKGWQGKVKEDPRQAMRDESVISQLLSKLYAYALMHKDEDTGDSARQIGRAHV